MSSEKPNGIESGMAVLERMLACGEITQEERMRAAHAHLAAVYKVEPCDCPVCSAQRHGDD
jgi:hypothetical protein